MDWVLSSGRPRGGVSNLQSSDNRKIQGRRDDQVHINPVLETVKAPRARRLRALGLRARGLRALGLRADGLRTARLRACMAHARGFAVVDIARLSSAIGPAGFKLF